MSQQRTVDQALFDRAAAQGRLKEAEEEIREKHKQYKAKCDEVLTTVADLAAQRAEREAWQARYAELEQAKESAAMYSSETIKALRCAEGREETLTKDLELARQELQNKGSYIQQLQKDDIERRDQLLAARCELADMKTQLSSIKDSFERSQEAEAAANATAKSLQSDNAATLLELQRSEEQVRIHVQTAQHLAADKERERERLELKCNEYNDRCVALQIQLDGTKKDAEHRALTTERQVHGVEQHNKDLVSQNSTLQRQVSEVRIAASTAEAQVVDLRAQLEILRTDKEQESSKIRELQSSLIERNEAVTELEEEIEEHKSEVQELTEAKDILREEAEASKIQLSSLREQQARAERDIEELRASWTADVTQTRNALEARLSEAAQERDRVETELKEERTKALHAADSHRDERCRMEQELLTVRQELQALDARFKVVQQERDEAWEHKASVMTRYKTKRLVSIERET